MIERAGESIGNLGIGGVAIAIVTGLIVAVLVILARNK